MAVFWLGLAALVAEIISAKEIPQQLGKGEASMIDCVRKWRGL